MGLNLPAPDWPVDSMLNEHAAHLHGRRTGRTQHIREERTADRHLALGAGPTNWKRAPSDIVRQPSPSCLCGQSQPSMPHLLWGCPDTAHERDKHGVDLPTERLPGRRLLRPVPPWPPPVATVGPQPFPQELTQHLRQLAATGWTIIVATVGGTLRDHAAWGVSLSLDVATTEH